jgi:E3 ubiquitin-protein ligase mind-bomb
MMMTAVSIAAFKNRVEILEMLIKAGADINIPCLNDQTPLHLALKKQHNEIIKLLLKN